MFQSISFFLFLTVSVAAAQQCVSRVIAFGDSLSDNAWADPDDMRGFEIYSNGEVWPSYLRRMISPSIPYLSVAWGGATTGWDNFNASTGNRTGFLWQVRDYIAPSDVAMTLHTILVGWNDIFKMLFFSLPMSSLDTSVANVVAGVRYLYTTKGARQFLISYLSLDVPPFFRAGGDGFAWATQALDGVKYFNAMLAGNMSIFTSECPTCTFYAFTPNPTQSTQYFLNSATPWSEIKESHPLDQADFAFWDEYHPMSRYHWLTAQAAKAALGALGPCIPAYQNVTMMLYGIGSCTSCSTVMLQAAQTACATVASYSSMGRFWCYPTVNCSLCPAARSKASDRQTQRSASTLAIATTNIGAALVTIVGPPDQVTAAVTTIYNSLAGTSKLSTYLGAFSNSASGNLVVASFLPTSCPTCDSGDGSDKALLGLLGLLGLLFIPGCLLGICCGMMLGKKRASKEIVGTPTSLGVVAAGSPMPAMAVPQEVVMVPSHIAYPPQDVGMTPAPFGYPAQQPAAFF